jgi:hypothetical protein
MLFCLVIILLTILHTAGLQARRDRCRSTCHCCKPSGDRYRFGRTADEFAWWALAASAG